MNILIYTKSGRAHPIEGNRSVPLRMRWLRQQGHVNVNVPLIAVTELTPETPERHTNKVDDEDSQNELTSRDMLRRRPLSQLIELPRVTVHLRPTVRDLVASLRTTIESLEAECGGADDGSAWTAVLSEEGRKSSTGHTYELLSAETQ
ncbi:hypothetical protein J6590_083511 [Homalodisca vitripennis]|nr:hypothetical protein J6590_083511 [Homalodisca vitripennis]